MIALRVLAGIAGLAIILATIMSAVRTVIVPRGVSVRLTRSVFLGMRSLFELRVGKDASYEHRDRVFAHFAPITLLVLLMAWLTLEFVGYSLLYFAIGDTIRDAAVVSGSALLTLGLIHPDQLGVTVLSFTEAAVGFIILALLISYLPTLYGIFSRREAAVQALETRAGSPPTAGEMLLRYWRIEFLHELPALWERWETWFVEVAETHTSFPALAFFRSPEPAQSWVTAGGSVLDAASFVVSSVDQLREPRAELMIRSGYIALRRIARFFEVDFPDNPQRGDPISIRREEYDAVYDMLAAEGMPLRADREQAWL
ncbi:MAG: hypothetical protein ACRDKG_05855, partial [Actinomycetota bacterium]